MRVCVGGTFDPLHRGHRTLLNRAMALSTELYVGLTSDEMAVRGRIGKVSSYIDRERSIREYISSRGFSGPVVVSPLNDRLGPSAREEGYDAIVVSPETRPIAEEINRERTDRGFDPLDVHVIDTVVGSDGMPVKGTRVRLGLTDEDGKERVLKVAVGSASRAKLEGVRRAFDGWAPSVELISVEWENEGVPTGSGIMKGARARALYAIKQTNADVAVGVESGLVYDHGCKSDGVGNGDGYCNGNGVVNGDSHGDCASMIMICAAVIIDRRGGETRGYGPAFTCTEDDFDENSSRSVVEVKSRGWVEREELVQWAVKMALVPRTIALKPM